MDNLPLVTSDTLATDEQFWSSVLLYHNRPHLINRRLLGISQVLFLKVDFHSNSIKHINELFTYSAILYEVRKLPHLTTDFVKVELVRNILETYDNKVSFANVTQNDFINSNDGIFVSVRILLARQVDVDNCLEIVTFDKTNKMSTFLAVTEFNKKELAPTFPYSITLTSGYVTIWLQSLEDVEKPSAVWLTEQLFLKLMKWIEDYDPSFQVQNSLSLISVEMYTHLYHNFKLKYGRHIIEEWPENTDPHKFVYEDLAIAAYLISLWKLNNPNKKPTFIDLGCGNGLLTHVLTEEGYFGTGIDVRKRKIWDLFKTANLKEEIITPSDSCLFPQTDWIIGNHSDELTPWIPVIAARSSYKCNIFLLPCCAYEFNGQKYRRQNTSISTYADYLQYVEKICITCGFKIAVDRLRIPSTKRTCLVSFGRTYDETKAIQIDEYIQNMIGQNSSNTSWINDFVARSNLERVRNCTKLDRTLVTNIIQQICGILLKKYIPISKYNGDNWNKGNEEPLSSLAEFLGKENLKELKKECGGLQTLLKNHRYIFEVTGGCVKLRLPTTAEDTGFKYKKKLCWFYRNHPNGCLHTDEVCAYEH